MAGRRLKDKNATHSVMGNREKFGGIVGRAATAGISVVDVASVLCAGIAAVGQ